MFLSGQKSAIFQSPTTSPPHAPICVHVAPSPGALSSPPPQPNTPDVAAAKTANQGKVLCFMGGDSVCGGPNATARATKRLLQTRQPLSVVGSTAPFR